MVDALGVDAKVGCARSTRRHRKRNAVLILVAVAVAFEAWWVSDPRRLAPRDLEIWGSYYNADGNSYRLQIGQDDPWPNAAISYNEVLRRDPDPIIVRQTSWPFLIGLQIVPAPAPSRAARTIYLQVGADAYIPYRQISHGP